MVSANIRTAGMRAAMVPGAADTRRRVSPVSAVHVQRACACGGTCAKCRGAGARLDGEGDVPAAAAPARGASMADVPIFPRRAAAAPERSSDVSVLPVGGLTDDGDSTVDGDDGYTTPADSGGGAAPALGGGAAPAIGGGDAEPMHTPPATCACCVRDVTISNVSRIDNATHMGHSFDVNISMEYPAASGAGAATAQSCVLQWFETTNVPAIPGHTPNTRTDMYALYPQSPTFDPWRNRGAGSCGGNQAVTITDPPALAKRPGRTVTRTLDFDIVVSSAGTGCTNVSKHATPKQVLKMVNGAADWGGSSFTP